MFVNFEFTVVISINVFFIVTYHFTSHVYHTFLLILDKFCIYFHFHFITSLSNIVCTYFCYTLCRYISCHIIHEYCDNPSTLAQPGVLLRASLFLLNFWAEIPALAVIFKAKILNSLLQQGLLCTCYAAARYAYSQLETIKYSQTWDNLIELSYMMLQVYLQLFALNQEFPTQYPWTNASSSATHDWIGRRNKNRIRQNARGMLQMRSLTSFTKPFW